MLVDASGDPVRHLARARRPVGEFDTLILTHTHTDHIYALPSLFHNMYMDRRDKPLGLVGNAETLSFARSLLQTFGLLDRPGGMEIVWTEAGPGKPLDLGETSIDFFPTVHSCPCLGFLVKERGTTLVYSSDGAPNPLIKDLDVEAPVLIHEATGLHADAETLNAEGHSSAKQAGAMAAKIGATTLFVCAMRPCTPADVERIRQEASTACQVPVVVPAIDKGYLLKHVES
ncbi:MAG: MBL fold metallo-hydrolase [Rhodospirillales bacterium]|nr:MBL fold metallo-hydrolase [Rhodospirillales bacterium]